VDAVIVDRKLARVAAVRAAAAAEGGVKGDGGLAIVIGGSRAYAASQETAVRKTPVAQATTTAHSGTSTAKACHTAGPVKVPAASTRDAWTR
jgi:hypothetical protein